MFLPPCWHDLFLRGDTGAKAANLKQTLLISGSGRKHKNLPSTLRARERIWAQLVGKSRKIDKAFWLTKTRRLIDRRCLKERRLFSFLWQPLQTNIRLAKIWREFISMFNPMVTSELRAFCPKCAVKSDVELPVAIHDVREVDQSHSKYFVATAEESNLGKTRACWLKPKNLRPTSHQTSGVTLCVPYYQARPTPFFGKINCSCSKEQILPRNFYSPRKAKIFLITHSFV